MPNVNFELNLNKHPKDVINRSLVAAKNIRVSNDFSCLQSEESIFKNIVVAQAFNDEKEIIGYIPCNKEFILFVVDKGYTDEDKKQGIKTYLYRYKETTLNNNNYDAPEINMVYNEFKWYGGKIKGTFTYNIKNQLIIAVSEYDSYENALIPLKTINLGTGDSNENIKETDLGLNDSQLSLNPEIKIPSIIDYNYEKGLSYKGWYNIFIRYKINEVDYTKWYDVGYPILIDEIEQVKIFDYFIKSSVLSDHECFRGQGVCDYISSNSDTCDNTIRIQFDHNNNNYEKYQIGLICSTKTDKKAFKSLDIDCNINEFILNFKSLEEYNVNDLIFEKYNYYNVGNLINYKNRLYISNYNENIKKYSELEEVANKVRLSIEREEYNAYNSVRTTQIDGYKLKVSTTLDDYVINTETINLYTNQKHYKDNKFRSSHTVDKEVKIVKLYASLFDENDNLIDTKYITEFDGNTPVDDIKFRSDVYFKNNVSINFEIGDFNLEIHKNEFTTDLGYEVNFDFDFDIFQNNVFTDISEKYTERLKRTTLIPGNSYKFYIHFVNKYGEYTDGIPLKNIIENNYIKSTEDGIVTINGVSLNRYSNGSTNNTFIYYLNIYANNILNTQDYNGFFITYEKFKKSYELSGIFTRYDFPYKTIKADDSKGESIYYITKSLEKDKQNKYKFRFYSNELDIYENIELNFKQIMLDFYDIKDHPKVGEFRETTDFNGFNTQGNCSGDATLLIPAISDYKRYIFDISKTSYVRANNFSKNNAYRGSYIEIELTEDSLNKFITFCGNKDVDSLVFKGVLISRKDGDEQQIYLEENKTLIKFTNVYYFDKINQPISVKRGLNGYITFNSAMIYNNNQVILNNAYNILVNDKYFSYIGSKIFEIDDSNDDPKANSLMAIPFIGYYHFIDYNNYPYESKTFNTLPKIIAIRTEAVSDEIRQAIFSFINATIVEPINSYDLFKRDIVSYDEVASKIYKNYTINFVERFDKRVIRSNVIADESFENSWRTFNSESYKDITENKGNITNIVAMGTTFLVHTEHSLFMLDRDNTLQNGDNSQIQLHMPDVFDVDYKEVFASNLGSCGLQDKRAWILDDFGYIFYDNDANRIYKFNSKKIDIIDLSIVQFINRYKPDKLRFFYDKQRNRILTKIVYTKFDDSLTPNQNNEITLSYNDKLNKWISEHDYIIYDGFSTKQQLYMIGDDKGNIFNFNFGDNDFNNVYNSRNIKYNYFEINNDDKYKVSTLSILINDKYELIKTLEFITWKLYKIKQDTNTNVGREFIKTPYSGAKLRIYNDNVDSGIINITVNSNDNKNTSVMNYKKPWWQYDNWNFNYFRDIKNALSKKANFMSRLYGNYFIVELWFDDEQTVLDGERVEFETLNCKLTNNITI